VGEVEVESLREERERLRWKTGEMEKRRKTRRGATTEATTKVDRRIVSYELEHESPILIGVTLISQQVSNLTFWKVHQEN